MLGLPSSAVVPYTWYRYHGIALAQRTIRLAFPCDLMTQSDSPNRPQSRSVPPCAYPLDGGPASLELLGDSDAVLEFSLTASAQSTPLSSRVQNFLIYGAESDLPDHKIRAGESAPSVLETIRFFTKHAGLFGANVSILQQESTVMLQVLEDRVYDEV
eukprot:SAG11_NODE_1282_length_5310_cov_24.980426_4_plen_158_part_00